MEEDIVAFNELEQLRAFMEQLRCSGMRYEDIAARGYDFAVALYRSREELAMPRGTQLSALLQVQIMDHAADLLKMTVDPVPIERPKN